MAPKRSGEQFASLPSGLDLCYETFGRKSDPVVLLIMGLGGPMGWWPTEFCARLAERGFRVVRYDNRDTGRSTKLRQHRVGRGDVVKAFLGRGTAPYGISDLADDAAGLLDALDVDRAHVVGVSMGGMIAQTLAIEHPERLLSLTSIMSTTGRRTVGWQHPKVFRAMLTPGARTRDEHAAQAVRAGHLIGSPGYPISDDEHVERAHETYDRGWIASGVSRHMMAVLTQPDRTERLQQLDLPTTVIHGQSDVLVHKSGGRATAAAIPGAELIEIEGMGHDLPSPLWDRYLDAIVATTERACASTP